MPRFDTNDDTMDSYALPNVGSMKFSAVKPEILGATEYTLVTILIDVTGSVNLFADKLLNALKSIITSCKKSPRAENLLVRVVTFNTSAYEIHGFKLLSLIDVDNDYKEFQPDGMTALFDAAYNGIGSMLEYSKILVNKEFTVNGVVYIITDGGDNYSCYATPNMIAKAVSDSQNDEIIESLTTILIGINALKAKKYLDDFKDKAKLTQFIDVGDANEKNLAKLANFVSKSISSTSSLIGSGAAPSLVF